MNKEKEIEEMYDEIYADIAIQFGAGDYIEGDDREVLAKQIVKHLQELGYRKADEVRKETAREILEYLRAVQEKDELKNCDLDWIAMQYGVEVEE